MFRSSSIHRAGLLAGVVACVTSVPAIAQHGTRDRDAALAAHAGVRARVGVAPLTWSPRLAALATDWANHLCSLARHGTAVLQHRGNAHVGENLFWQGGGEPPPVSAAVQSWADEQRFFDARSGRCNGGECRHYTQLVWRNTTSVGCGAASCGANHFWVCDYEPPGNWVGQRPY
jgi:hypothetical protein